MPQAQFVHQTRGIDIQRTMRTPKKIQDQEAWVRAARQVIPEVPDLRRSDWYIQDFDASLKTIVITFHNTIQERCRLAIGRSTGMT